MHATSSPKPYSSRRPPQFYPCHDEVESVTNSDDHLSASDSCLCQQRRVTWKLQFQPEFTACYINFHAMSLHLILSHTYTNTNSSISHHSHVHLTLQLAPISSQPKQFLKSSQASVSKPGLPIFPCCLPPCSSLPCLSNPDSNLLGAETVFLRGSTALTAFNK